ncbi:hypothetical protein ANN_01428 [Periplaneta americana]|uniref:Uncharacterized protein n=1 Tax=Periplaneta americana TaxID=6978 RepID=A0ABQ8TV65_PERAM|nr:hypothetical protein ANN_01428 [Periplaneta americana]
MAGLCEGGNEPPDSLKAICNWLFNDAVSTTRQFSVDEIGNSGMVFGDLRPRIRHRLPDIRITVGENLGKKRNQYKSLFRDNRHAFVMENLEMTFVVHCNSRPTTSTEAWLIETECRLRFSDRFAAKDVTQVYHVKVDLL